jgi:hypothetical protein
MDAAEAAGGPKAEQYVDKMKKVKALLQDLAAAHRAKAAGDLLRLGPQTLDLDHQIAEGTGKVRDRIRGYYADGLYLKGVEAIQDEDYGKAAERLKEAVTVEPNHRLAQERLDELGRKAKQFYADAVAQKDSNPAEAKKLFKRVASMTRPDNPLHQKALNQGR